MNEFVYSTLGSLVGTGIVVVLGYFLAVKQYLRQKSVDIIRERYIDKGLYGPLADLKRNLEMGFHNYLLVLQSLELLSEQLTEGGWEYLGEMRSKIFSRVELNENIVVFNPIFFRDYKCFRYVLRAQYGLRIFNEYILYDLPLFEERVKKILADSKPENDDDKKLITSITEEMKKKLERKYFAQIRAYVPVYREMSDALAYIDSNNPASFKDLQKIISRDEYKRRMIDLNDEIEDFFKKKFSSKEKSIDKTEPRL